jgi:Berberine and berberine like
MAVVSRRANEVLRLLAVGRSNEEIASASYGCNHARLAEVKRAYDPTHLLGLNQNIRPFSRALLHTPRRAAPRSRPAADGVQEV